MDLVLRGRRRSRREARVRGARTRTGVYSDNCVQQVYAEPDSSFLGKVKTNRREAIARRSGKARSALFPPSPNQRLPGGYRSFKLLLIKNPLYNTL